MCGAHAAHAAQRVDKTLVGPYQNTCNIQGGDERVSPCPGRKLPRSRQELSGRRQAGGEFCGQDFFCLRQEAGRSLVSGAIYRQEHFCLRQFDFCLDLQAGGVRPNVV